MNHRGYTMVDAILAVAMIMVLIVIATPSVLDYLNLQKEQREAEIQTEILRAMRAYAADNNGLPAASGASTEDDISVLAQMLSEGYTSLSAPEMTTDAWGNARHYRLIQELRSYRETSFSIQYVMLLSFGRDGCQGETERTGCVTLLEEDITLLLASPDDFNALVADEGDFMTTYTDLEVKTEQLQTTRDRLNRISDALANYGTLKRYEGIANGLVETLIYLPPSSIGNEPGAFANVTHEISSSDIVTEVIVDGSDTARRDAMQQLMRLIGLPEEYCCTPLYKDVDGGESAFYYYANPRPRLVNGGVRSCGSRPSARYLPARVVVGHTENDSTFHNSVDVCG